MKKILWKITMASVVMTIVLSNTVLAVSPEVLAKLREFPTTKMELKDFSKEVTIYFVGKDGKKKNIGKDFKYGYKALNNRTSVGIRDLSEALDVDIQWDNENRVVILKTEGKELVYPVDKKVMANNGELVELDTSSTIDPSQGRTFAPLRSIAETLGYKVTWDQPTFTATLYAPGVEVDKKEEPKPEQKPDTKPADKNKEKPNNRLEYSPYLSESMIYSYFTEFKFPVKKVRDISKIPPVDQNSPVRFGPEMTLSKDGKKEYLIRDLKYSDEVTMKSYIKKDHILKIKLIDDGQVDVRVRSIGSVFYDNKYGLYRLPFSADNLVDHMLDAVVTSKGKVYYVGNGNIITNDYNKNLADEYIVGILYLDTIPLIKREYKLDSNGNGIAELKYINIDAIKLPGKIDQSKDFVDLK